MSDNKDKSKTSQPSALNALNLLVNNPITTNPTDDDDDDNSETNSNLVPVNQMDNSDDHDDDDNSVNEDIQRKMNDVINDLKSESITPDNNNLAHRKSIASVRLNDDQENRSTPAIVDPPTNNTTQDPLRSMSESNLLDHHNVGDQSATLPIQQDVSSTDGDDFDGLQPKSTNAIFGNNKSDNKFGQGSSLQKQDNQRPSSATKQNNLNEIKNSTNNSRTPSASSRRSLSISGDNKQTQSNNQPSTSQENPTLSRRSSQTKSPIERPRSPLVGEQARPSSRISSAQTKRDPSHVLIIDEPVPKQQRENVDPPTAGIPSSRRGSATQSKTNDASSKESTNQPHIRFQPTDIQSKLIKPGEQLLIPTNDTDDERINSPPPASFGIKGLALMNPVVENNDNKYTEQPQSRPPSQTDRKSPTSNLIEKDKPNDDVGSPRSRPSSNTSQKQRAPANDQNSNLPSSRKGSQASLRQPATEQNSNLPSSRKGSQVSLRQPTTEQNSNIPSSRKGSQVSLRQPATEQNSNLPSSRKGSQASLRQPVDEQSSNLPSSRKGSQVSLRQPATEQNSNLPSSRKGSQASLRQPATEQNSNLPSSRKGSQASLRQPVDEQNSNLPSSRKGSQASLRQPVDEQNSNLPSSRKGSQASLRQPATEQNSNLPSSRKGSQASLRQPVDEQNSNLPSSRKGSQASLRLPSVMPTTVKNSSLLPLRRESQSSEQPVSSRRGSASNEQKPSSRRESLHEQQKNASRRGSQQPIPIDRSHELPSSPKQDQSNLILNKPDSRRSSTDNDAPRLTSARQERVPSSDKRQSPSQKNLNVTSDEIVAAPLKINSAKAKQKSEEYSLTTDSDTDHANNSKLPRVNSSSKQEKPQHFDVRQTSSSAKTTPTEENQKPIWSKTVDIPPLNLGNDDIPMSRPQSPNAEQIAERNPSSKKENKSTDGRKKKNPDLSLRRSNSAESSNYILLVDDKSLDSTSGNNTESEQHPRKRIRSRKKDVDTNTEAKIYPRKASVHERKTSKSVTKQDEMTTSETEHDPYDQTARRSVKKSKEPSNTNVAPAIKNLVGNDNDQKPQDFERHTQSDTEQIVTEKQKKRRRPKRISRTTQTYEFIFRRMEREEHEELRATTDTEKSIQTRKSQLRPRTKSPKKHLSSYLSTDAFKIEEILPKQFPSSQQNVTKTSVVAQSISPQNGKLLILRPTLPFHHTNAVSVQRVCLQYAIDLIPNESLSNQTNKSNSLKHSEQTSHLPMIGPSSSTPTTSTNKSNPKDKTSSNKNTDRSHQPKAGGAV